MNEYDMQLIRRAMRGKRRYRWDGQGWMLNGGYFSGLIYLV